MSRPQAWRRSWRGFSGAVVVAGLLVGFGWPAVVLAGGPRCLSPGCWNSPAIATVEPSTDGRAPTVLAAPCARSPVDQVLVRRTGVGQGTMLRLERHGAGARVFPLDRPVPGYRETTGRSPQAVIDQLTRYRQQQAVMQEAMTSRVPPTVEPDQNSLEVTLLYADGTRATDLLPRDTSGRLHYLDVGPDTEAGFAAAAADSAVCLPPVLRYGRYAFLPCLLLGLCCLLPAIRLTIMRAASGRG